MATIIKPCICASPYQDSKYGAGNRVHNVGKKLAACTVCDRKS